MTRSVYVVRVGGVEAVLGLWEKAVALTDVEETSRFMMTTFPVVKFEAGKRGSVSAKPGPRRPDDGVSASCGGALHAELAGITGGAAAAAIGGLIIFNSLTLFLQRFYSLLQKHVTQLMWSLEAPL